LTEDQVEALTNIYSPLLSASGQLLYPRYTPGAEADPLAAAAFFGGLFSSLAAVRIIRT
jgi:hypothetical protein